MVVPLAQVLGCIQRDIPFVHQTAAAPEGILAVQVVVLQEHQYVLLVNLHYTHFHCRKIDGLEGKYQVLLIRQYVALEGDGHGRSLFLLGENADVVLSEVRTAGALQALVHGEFQISFATFEMDFDNVLLHLHVAAGSAFQLYQSLDLGVGRHFAHKHVYAAAVKRGAYHPEGPAVVGFGRIFGESHAVPFDCEAEGELVGSSGYEFTK